MTSPCDRLDALLATSPEAATALPTLESALAQHAADCARCQAALVRSESLVRQLGQLHADFAPAPDLLQKVEDRLRPHTPPSRRPLLWAALGGAAAASLVAYWVARPSPEPAPEPIAAPTQPKPGPAEVEPFRLRVTHCDDTPCERPAHLATQVGQREVFRLSDGTRVALDQQSELSLGEPQSGRALRLLRGEARFDVVKRDDLPPLVVTLPNGQVQVLGTELQVRAGESLSVVEVLRGLVSVDDARVRAGDRVDHAAAFGFGELLAAGFDKVDYLEIRDADSLAPVHDTARPLRILAAAKIGRTRLIDNMPV